MRNPQQKMNPIIILLLTFLPIIMVSILFSATYNSLQVAGAGSASTITNSLNETTLDNLERLDVNDDSLITKALEQAEDTALQSGVVSPFWHVIPSDDGTSLSLQAANVDELSGDVFFALEGSELHPVGPSNYQHSYTMTYSETERTYIGEAIGMSSDVNFIGTVNMTSTTNLSTNTVVVRRFFVEAPIANPFDIYSTDGSFQAILVNPNTIENDTYIALAENDFPPEEVLPGHRLLSKSYSFRHPYADIFSQEPMLLRMYYDDVVLQDADPFMLAIFSWNDGWIELTGHVFQDQQYVSIATDRFATYALQVAPRWFDDFDDADGLASFNNVTLAYENGAPEKLVLVDGQTSGTAVSNLITLPKGFSHWNEINFEHTLDSPSAHLTIDVLSADDSIVLSNVSDGMSLESIDAEQYPSLKLRVTFSTDTSGETARLDSWRLSWSEEPAAPADVYENFLPFITK